MLSCCCFLRTAALTNSLYYICDILLCFAFLYFFLWLLHELSWLMVGLDFISSISLMWKLFTGLTICGSYTPCLLLYVLFLIPEAPTDYRWLFSCGFLFSFCLLPSNAWLKKIKKLENMSALQSAEQLKAKHEPCMPDSHTFVCSHTLIDSPE